jgi:hypothetical protein
MKVKSAIKKIEAYLNVKVEQVDGRSRFWFAYEGYVGSFLPNGSYPAGDVMEADACNWHIRRYDDHSDSQSDYFAGSFRSNLTQLLHSLKSPPCKYSCGMLVRGKQNKRAKRYGFAGLTGLVTKESSDSCSINWLGVERKDDYVSTRDLEVISAS